MTDDILGDLMGSGRYTLQEGKGILPTIPDYDPRVDGEWPEGYTVEYYGDDAIYIGYNGEIVSVIIDRPDVHVNQDKRTEAPDLEIVEQFIIAEVNKEEGTYKCEDWSGRNLMMRKGNG
jgi:hypothetical protein